MAVDPWHKYSNEAETANWDSYDDFKLNNLKVKLDLLIFLLHL